MGHDTPEDVKKLPDAAVEAGTAKVGEANSEAEVVKLTGVLTEKQVSLQKTIAGIKELLSLPDLDAEKRAVIQGELLEIEAYLAEDIDAGKLAESQVEAQKNIDAGKYELASQPMKNEGMENGTVQQIDVKTLGTVKPGDFVNNGLPRESAAYHQGKTDRLSVSGSGIFNRKTGEAFVVSGMEREGNNEVNFSREFVKTPQGILAKRMEIKGAHNEVLERTFDASGFESGVLDTVNGKIRAKSEIVNGPDGKPLSFKQIKFDENGKVIAEASFAKNETGSWTNDSWSLDSAGKKQANQKTLEDGKGRERMDSIVVSGRDATTALLRLGEE